MRTFETGANRNNDVNKLDYEGFLNPRVLECFAKYMQKHSVTSLGQRTSDNWQKGMPKIAYAKSLIRHTIHFWKIHRGYSHLDEDSKSFVTIKDLLCAILFNAMGYLLEMLKEEGDEGPIGFGGDLECPVISAKASSQDDGTIHDNNF